ncbi:MAG: LapA family protein [Desulfobacterales bacterium]|nr:LapA family protein [Desulfobacterales bacterium]
MKTIKILFFLVILGLLGLLYYQNTAYFLGHNALGLDLKISGWNWHTPELPNYAWWGLCFGLGLLITGIKGMFTSFRLGREIKRKDADILTLREKQLDLQAKLDVFTHDPYIQKGIENETPAADADKADEGKAAESDAKADEKSE